MNDRTRNDEPHDSPAHGLSDLGSDDAAALLNAALAGVRTPFALFDLHRRRLRCNREYLELLQLDEAELAARGVDALDEAGARLIETSAEVRRFWERPADREYRDILRFRDGRQFERVVTPYGPPKRAACLAIAFRDLTESVASERQLATSRTMLERAQQVAHVGSWVHDHVTDRLEWTDESRRIFGIEDQPFPTTLDGFLLTVHPDDRDRFRAAHARMQESGSYDIEHRLLRPNGEVVWVHQRADFEVDASGRRLRTVGTLQDVTGRRRLEEQLRQAQKLEAVGRLAGGVAHDLNNALTSIVGYTELVLAAMSTAHPATPDVLEIRRAAERAESVTRQLLAFSRKQPLTPRVFGLADTINALTRMLQRFLGSRLELVIDVDPDVAPITGDPGQIEQAIVNLAANAKDAMPDGGRLHVTLAMVQVESGIEAPHDPVPPGRFVELAVRDTGTGMTPDVLAHVFEPFFTTKEPGKGTGLGLAMVYGTVKQIGGYIAVESAAGRGSTFRLFFPPATEPIPARRSETASAAPLIRDGRDEPTILVVEDETPVRNLVLLSLSNRGYRVLAASSGRHALEIMNNEAVIDLLLTDANMPGMSGVDLAREVLATNRASRVIVMSGFTEDLPRLGDSDDRVELLSKPFTPRELRDRVGRIFARQ